jgi:hypothetical protein
MPVTLAQAKLNTLDDVQAGVIDEFRKSSFLLENMPFDDAVTPGTSGATLTYGYQRLITQPTAAFRAVNSEFTPQEVTKQRYTTELKPFGGSFEIDRLLSKTGGLIGEVQLQVEQKAKAARALFHDTVINGDSAVDVNSFDGLNKAIAASSTDYNIGGANHVDLSTSAALDSNYKVFLDKLEDFLALLNEKPSALMGNSKLISKIKQVARRAGYLTQSEDAFGRKVDQYDGIPLVNMGDKPGSTNPVIPMFTRDTITGCTDLYAATFSMDGFHGVTLANDQMMNVWLPDFSVAGAVKKGEVEMVAAVALKATKQAGVFRNVKVQ